MELTALFRRLDNKVVSEHEISRLFGTKSLDDLLITLRKFAREDYFKFEAILSAEYYKWGQAHRDLLLRADVLTPVDPFGALQRDSYGLSVKSEAPLSEREIIEVIQKLPPDMAERYLRFKLSDINTDKMHEFVVARQKESGADKEEYYDRVEYNGLVVDGVQVKYNDELIELSFQPRQALRLLMKKKGKLCYKDEFTHAEAGIFNRSQSKVKDHALRNLIYEVRKELRVVTKQDCIISTPGEGWSLKLEP